MDDQEIVTIQYPVLIASENPEDLTFGTVTVTGTKECVKALLAMELAE